MELTFPFKNYALNSLLHFYEQSYIYKFYDSKMSIEEYLADDFDSTNYQDSIASFENELLQVIILPHRKQSILIFIPCLIR